MIIVNLLVLIAGLLLLNGLLLALHQISPRYGIMPMVAVAAALVAVMRFASAVGVYVQVTPDLRFTFAGNVLVPTIILVVLVIYLTEGTIPARLTILTILGVEVLSLVLYALLAWHLRAPGGGSLSGLPPDDPLINPTFQLAFASGLAFLIDMIFIAVMFQWLINHAARVPLWFKAGFTLVATLILNNAVFWAVAAVSIEEFMTFYPGTAVGGALSGLLLTPVLALYLRYAAPRLPHYRGLERRPTFALLFGSFGQIERRLEGVQHERDALANVMGEQVDKERDRAERLRDFVNEIVHDMRSPITGLNLRIDIIRRSDDHTQREKQLASMRAQLAHLTALVASASDFARIENDPTDTLLEQDIRAIARGAFDPIRLIGEEKGLTMQYVPGDAPLRTLADPISLGRAVSNLLENAVRYTAQGTVTLRAYQVEAQVIIEVTDSGMGVTDDELPHLFDRYFRTRRARESVQGGSGLGLAIVRRVVEDQHGGTIGAARNPAGGMTFTISLPVLRAGNQNGTA